MFFSRRLARVVRSRWFALADLFVAIVAAVLVVSQPGWGGWPLFIGLLPGLVRVFAGEPPLSRTPHDLALALFLVTAGVGVWAAYQPGPAWVKFWMLVSAALLYGSLARQPKENWPFISAGLGMFGLGVAFVFLLTQDWSVMPAKVGALTPILAVWMRVRPAVFAPAVLPNTAAGVSASCGGFLAVLCANAWRSGRRIQAALWGLGVAVILVTLAVSGSRGVWMALVAILGGWLLGKLGGWISGRSGMPRKVIWGVEALLVGGLLAGMVIWQPGLVIRLAGALPGPAQAGNRLELDRADLALITDYPFTGGGLGEFAGQYSQYVMVTPVYLLGYGHNIFLDVALEQGVLGGVSLGILLIGSLWQLLDLKVDNFEDLFRVGILAGLAIVMVHGLVDDVIYNTSFLPLLLVFPGLMSAMATARPSVQPAAQPWLAWAGAAAVILAVGMFFNQQIVAGLAANLGAVAMARVELADFPSGRWGEGEHLQDLKPAEDLFHQALRLDPTNPTANYRLGLIAIERRNFSAAEAYLRAALEKEPGNRGIRKALGFSCAWQGKINDAEAFLKDLPEVRDELSAYPTFWQTLGRGDLADDAKQLQARLAGASRS